MYCDARACFEDFIFVFLNVAVNIAALVHRRCFPRLCAIEAEIGTPARWALDSVCLQFFRLDHTIATEGTLLSTEHFEED